MPRPLPHPAASALSLILLLLPTSSQGHSDITEVIQALSKQIAQKPSADLFFQRATEFRALRERAHAIEDLKSALQLQPDHRLAITSLIQLSPPNPQKLALIQRYADFATCAENPAQHFEATYLLAQYYAEIHLPSVSLFLCEGLQKLRKNPQNSALDLLHAEVLTSLGKHAEATHILKNAWRRTNSIVLRNQWIDTALTAGLTSDCLPIIEEELASSRFLSSWLIRRARAALIHNDPKHAHQDLQQALSEISTRLRPKQPDLTLIADRGLALALLGKREQAQAHLAQLKKSTLPRSAYHLLRRELQAD